MQIRVRQRFKELRAIDENEKRVLWYDVDASQTVEEVQKDINNIVGKTMKRVAEGAELSKMFGEGKYQLPDPSKSES